MPVPHTDDDRRAITQIRKQIGSFRTMVQDIPEALREHGTKQVARVCSHQA
jgi:hypothetical protein